MKRKSDLGNKEIFSKNLQTLLKKRHLTQKEVADAIGVSTSTFCDWIKERAYPRMDKIQLLADYFNIEKSDLIEKKDVYNKYYLDKLAHELHENPDAALLYEEIKSLDDSDKELVRSLIKSLKGKK